MRHRPFIVRRFVAPPRRAALALGVLALGACGTAPPTHFHSLMPVEIAVRPSAAGAPAATGIAFVLEPIRLPAQVDQPQWLVQLGDDSVAMLEQERWASPLRDEFRQALLEELIIGQGAVDARTQPAVSTPARIAIDVRRFDSLPGREARIEGSWTITGGDARSLASRCEWLIREPAAKSFPALAAAHRRAVAR
ncbi:MAG: PqiC family protein, partial [Pseudomonadota bacterium]|nr:PqiC family protein [Pseudomonadota bacterium]